MKNTIATCLFLAISCSLFAQKTPKLVGYFNEYWGEVNAKSEAKYYRTVEKQPDGQYLVRDFYMSGKPQMEPVTCTVYSPKLVWEGNHKLYYENGTIQEEGYFKNEGRYGLHKYWYDNGDNHKVVWYDEEGKELKIHQYWSTTGEEFLTNGNGIIKDQQRNGNITFSEVIDSVRIASFSIDETISDTVYFFVQTPPEYKGGVKAMHNVVASNTKYPINARRRGIEGTVYIAFVVDEQGKCINPTLLKGISEDCDKEALRVVALLNDWNPALHHGKPVKVKFVYPIKFKLGKR